MYLHYGLFNNETLHTEINFDTFKTVSPDHIIYDDATCKIGVIVNDLINWKAPEIITVWFDEISDYVIVQYGLNIPTCYNEESRDTYIMEGQTRPRERKSGKVRETYNDLFNIKLEELERQTA